jgi:hypothetical protein
MRNKSFGAKKNLRTRGYGFLHNIIYVIAVAAAPSVGSPALHAEQQAALVEQALFGNK